MKYENKTFYDLMGIVIETDNEWLNKKLNQNLCYGGGGGSQSQTTTPVIPTEFKPFATKFGAELDQAVSAGDVFGQVQGFTPDQIQAQQAARAQASRAGGLGQFAEQQYRQQASGTGLFGQADLSGMAKELSRQAGMQQADMRAGAMAGGTLGSARQRMAQAQGDAALQGKFAELGMTDLAARRQAASGAANQLAGVRQGITAEADILRNVGSEIQKQKQAEAGAQATGLKEIGGIFTGVPVGQTSVSSGGGK